MTLPPWLVGLVIVYVIALTSIFSYLFMEQVQRKRRKARRSYAPEFDRDGDIIAVAEQGIAEAPELADDEEAAARTVALTDAAMDGALVLIAADLQARPDVSLPARIEVERLLIEIDRCIECYRDGQEITEGAPKEWTP